ncbi:hypothetical protein JTE90_012814 [Oedothorax gibbosus]|uniref:Fibroin heavy chain-like n=1 Tax=Oedothorax gibbosus TaxID=931172 RepID=A0AAV6W1F9_9ARAC|nr:hypothetical protein JTE90_012814 [Oedothorax gibbosus]
MNLVFSFLALLVSTNVCLAAVKGGRTTVGKGGIAGIGGGPHVHFGKGGAGGALHHSAVVADPISGSPVLVDQVTSLGGGAGGIKGAGLGAGSAQYTLGDGLFGQRRSYRVGASQYPYGLLGSDFYSFPQSLMTSPRNLYGRKSILGNNLSGLSPIGVAAGLRKGGVLVDPTTSQFSIGDAQIKTSLFGGRGLYRTGASSVPYGLMGSDYYSYPQQLLTQRRLGDTFGLGQSQILGGGSLFGAGDSQIRGGGLDGLGGIGGIGQQQVSLLGDGEEFGQRKVVTTTVTQAADPISAALGQGQVTQTTVTKSAGGLGGGLRGGNIFLSGRPGIGGGLRRVKTRVQPAGASLLLGSSSGLGAPFGGFGQRQVAVTKAAPIVQAAPVQILQAPVAAAPIQRRIISSRRPGDVFLTQAARPRVVQRVVQQRAPGNIQFTLGGNQIIGGPIAPQQSFVSAPRQVFTSPRQVVVAQQPQVISQIKTSPVISNSIFGNRAPQLIYNDGGKRFPGIDIIGGSRIGDPRLGYTQLPISTRRFATLGGLSKIGGSGLSSPFGLGGVGAGSKIGGLAAGGLGGIGAGGLGGLGAGSKIGGLAAGGLGGIGALGLGGIGGQTKTITQEEVVGPAGNPQILTTVTQSSPSVGSKIGGLATGGLGGIGQGSQKVVTQEEVVGPLGDRQVITTVSDNGSGRLAGGKIGGLAAGGLGGIGAGGLGGIGGQTKTITQEEVVGPAGDSAIITTVTQSDPSSKIGGLASGGLLGIGAGGKGSSGTVVQQEEVVNPITGAVSQITTTTQQLSQDPLSQSFVDPLSGGQVSVDPFTGGAQSQQVSVDPFSGVQENIADSIVQESISSGLGGGYNLDGYLPRVSFLSQYPYDVPSNQLLRSVISSPVFQQQQQEVEQIYVK